MSGVTVVGSVNVDLVVRTPRLPLPGETALGTSMTRVPGGKGANQAVALARLGVAVSLVGAVGDDAEGELSLRSLDGVDTSGVRRVEGEPTGLALITADDAGENTIVVVPGANDHVGAPPVVDALVVQLEVPLDVVVSAVHAATGLVVLNAAPAAALPPELLSRVDVLNVNEGEALAVAVADDVDAAVGVLVPRVRTGVVVTRGAAGCLVASTAGTTVLSSPPAEVVDTVGAGDAFVAATTWALLDGRSLVDAARIGCVAGSLSVRRAGARSSPTLTELRAELAT